MMRRRELDPEGYRVYGLGEWGESEGLILPHYTVACVNKEPDFYDRVAIGQDFGYNHANCILTIGLLDGDVYVLSELYTRYKDTAEIMELAERAGVSKSTIMWCDSAEPDRIRSWRKGGYRAQAVSKESGSVRAQIDYLKSHKIIIDPSCEALIREIGMWKWQRDASSGSFIDEPVCINDDAIASLRYAIEGERKRNGPRAISKKLLYI